MVEEKRSPENWLAPTDSSNLLGAITTRWHLSLLIVSSLDRYWYVSAFRSVHGKHDPILHFYTVLNVRTHRDTEIALLLGAS